MDREYWLIPKRSDLHQAIVLLHGLYENYNGKSWNASAQDRIGSYIAKKGSTNNGRNITPQSIRTLLAGIPQFFGFVIKDDDFTPPRLSITNVGKKIIEETKRDIENISFSNLREGVKTGKTITYSNYYLLQFVKLQITNPNIISYCANIFVFPLYCLLSVLKNVDFLSQEEIAIYLFKIKEHAQIDFIVREIKIFRGLKQKEKEDLINSFKKTDNGNKSLVQAPSTTYFLSLCSHLDLFNIKRGFISLKENKLSEIDNILENYKKLKPINFGNDKNLWNDFYTNANVKTTPSKLKIINNYKNDIYISFKRNGKIIEQFILLNNNLNNEKLIYLINELDNHIEVMCCESHELLLNKNINEEKYELIIKSKDKNSSEDINYISSILEHINSSTFDAQFQKKINLLNKMTKNNFSKDKNLRGGRLEELFFLLLKSYHDKGIIKDHPIWNGKYDDNGLPRPAPGGRGYGDIVIFIKDLQIIFELTTIKSKTGQEKSEAFSVPHHIKNHSDENPSKKTIGVYLAPIIHERVTFGMSNNEILGNSKLHCMKIDYFLETFIDQNTEDKIYNFFNEL